MSATLTTLHSQLVASASNKIVDISSLEADQQVKQDIINQVFPTSQRKNTPGFNASAIQVIQDALDNGFIKQYYAAGEVAADCAKARKGDSTLSKINASVRLGASTGLSLTVGTAAHGSVLATLGIGVNVAPVVGQIIAGAVAVFAAISSLLAHHSLAVEQEQSILCAIVPKVNDAIQGLDEAVANGSVTPQQANTGLNNIQNSYIQNVQSIIKANAAQCNAACVIDRAVIALMLYKSYQYTQFYTGTSCSTCNSIEQSLSSITSNPFMIAIIAGLIVFVLTREL